MHTLIVILCGLVLLAAFVIIAHIASGGSSPARARAALCFIPVWFVAALVNMLVGIFGAGYSVAAEAAILLVVFGVPAAAAFGLRRFAL